MSFRNSTNATRVTRNGLANDLAGAGVKRGVERECAVTEILEAVPLGPAGRQGQHRIEAIERWDGRLLVRREDDGVLRRIQIQTQHIGRLFFELRIIGQHVTFEGVRLVARAAPVLTEYSVPVLAVAVAGQRLLPSSGRMTAVLIALLVSLRTTIRSRCELGAEILALRHQLAGTWRARDDAREDLQRCRHRLGKLLLRCTTTDATGLPHIGSGTQAGPDDCRGDRARARGFRGCAATRRTRGEVSSTENQDGQSTNGIVMRFGDGPRRRRMIRGTMVRIGGLCMRSGLLSQLATLDCTSSRRTTVMCALPRVTAVTSVYQRDSSSKRPRFIRRLSGPATDASEPRGQRRFTSIETGGG
jgi:hypothetical protein